MLFTFPYLGITLLLFFPGLRIPNQISSACIDIRTHAAAAAAAPVSIASRSPPTTFLLANLVTSSHLILPVALSLVYLFDDDGDNNAPSHLGSAAETAEAPYTIEKQQRALRPDKCQVRGVSRSGIRHGEREREAGADYDK